MVQFAQLPHSNLAPLLILDASNPQTIQKFLFFNKSKLDDGLFINMDVLLAHCVHILSDFSLIPGHIETGSCLKLLHVKTNFNTARSAHLNQQWDV